jgi:hypothetical protein
MRKLDGLPEAVQVLTSQIAQLSVRMEAEFSAIRTQWDAKLEERFREEGEMLDERFAQVDGRFVQIDRRFAQVAQRVELIGDLGRWIGGSRGWIRIWPSCERTPVSCAGVSAPFSRSSRLVS